MSERIVIISDTHLGRPGGTARSAEALVPIWQNASELIINGDIAEIHHPAYRAAAAREVVQLQSLCEDHGTELTLISGNHDPYISDLRHLSLKNDRVFITHGDV